MAAASRPTVAQLSDKIDELRGDFKDLAKSHDEIRVVVFNGLRDSVKEIRTNVAALNAAFPNLVAKSDLQALHIGVPAKKIMFRRIIEIAVGFTAFALVFGIIFAVIIGRLTADDAATIIRALVGN